MPEHRAFQNAIILTIVSLLAVTAATASPDRVRSRAAGFVQAVALGECDIAGALVDWPLQFEDESIELLGWQSPCEAMRARLATARIDAAFQSDALTSMMPPRQLEREDVYFVDLVMAQRPGSKQAPSGMNLAFECSQSECRLVAIHQRLLHHRHYRNHELDGSGARQGARTELERAMQAAQLAGVLQTMAPLKVMLTEHHAVTGEWPTSLEALGLESNRLHGRGIEKIEVLANGGIRAHLSADFGNGRTLDLVPTEQMDGLSMRWNCRTNLPGEMTAALGGVNCRIQ